MFVVVTSDFQQTNKINTKMNENLQKGTKPYTKKTMKKQKNA